MGNSLRIVCIQSCDDINHCQLLMPQVVKRLEKTKSENLKLDFKTLREERDSKERAQLREKEKKIREEQKELEKKRATDAELRFEIAS